MILNKKHILSIEDNDIVNFYNEDLVSELDENFEFIVKESVNSAIDYIKECIKSNEIPNFWLVDINLPDGKGFSILDEVLDLIDPNNLPQIYLLTTSIHQSDKDEFNTRKYIKGYLEKPLSLEVLKNSLTK